jgi:hypothetical protein
MRKRCLLALCLLGLSIVLLVPAGVLAATGPKITSVSPMSAAVGDVLTIRGSGFKPGSGENTVVFRHDDLYARVRAYSATRSTMKVKLPAKLELYMRRRDGKVLPTRFALRVGAAASAFTSRSDSPVIAPAPAPQ